MRRACVAALAAALVLTACGKKEDSGSSGGSSPSTPASSVNPSGLDGSKDLSAEFKKLMETTYATAKDNPSKLGEILKTFVLPDHDAWFRKTFNEEMAKAFEQRYAEQGPKLESEMVPLWTDKLVKDGQSDIRVFCLTDPNDGNATGLQKDALQSMKTKTPIYTVKFRKPGEELGMSVWSWAYVDGGFRFIGKGK